MPDTDAPPIPSLAIAGTDDEIQGKLARMRELGISEDRIAAAPKGTPDQIVELARHFRGTGHILRFIEFMPVGETNGWNMKEVVAAAEIMSRIDAEFPIEPVEAQYRGEVAKRWRYKDGSGEIGIIASVTQPFCGDCTRSRLSAEGKLYTCLFAVRGHDLRAFVRGGATDEELDEKLREIWNVRADRYSELRTQNTVDPAIGERKVEMSYIGG